MTILYALLIIARRESLVLDGLQKALDEKYPYLLTVYNGSESDCKLYVNLK